ncbi:MAG: fibrobacter succinogenes major paralogous domain-containing protein [Bacteroidales bacterium]|nr:fibrobacter succinogenes major paralogous domain-containing protein [Bacteroidales bacterium]
MRCTFKLLGLIIFFVDLMVFSSCEKDKNSIPVLNTFDVKVICRTNASSGGEVINIGGTNIISHGVCWSTTDPPTINDYKTSDSVASGKLSSILSGLNPGTKYFVRAYANNIVGIAYGIMISFKTQLGNLIFNPELVYGSVEDIDGNEYKTMQIGQNIWMAENLKTTKLNDGTPISLVTGNTEWGSLSIPGYCWYNNNDSIPLKAEYGALYNWYAVKTEILCPTGWHVPNDNEWWNISLHIGSHYYSGILAETGASHWMFQDPRANNETGLTLLPGGVRSPDGLFGNLGRGGSWWIYCGSQSISSWAILAFGSTLESHDYDKRTGFSVRCIKNLL